MATRPPDLLECITRTPRALARIQAQLHRLDFSIYQSGVDVKCPYSNRPFKPLNHLNKLMAGFV